MSLKSIAIALVLAGCTAPTSPSEPPKDLLPAFELGFAAPFELPQTTTGADPLLAVAPDGRWWVAAIGGASEGFAMVESNAWLWTSTDDGATWETLRQPVKDAQLPPQGRRPSGSLDTSLIVAGDGWVHHASWWVVRPPLTGVNVPAFFPNGGFLVESSPDGGATWISGRVALAEGAAGLIDAPRIAADGNGTVWMMYDQREPTPQANADAAIRRPSSFRVHVSEDHGATWSQAQVALGSDLANFHRISDLVYGGGRLWMPYGEIPVAADGTTDPSRPSVVRVMTSEDGGETWTVVDVAQAPSGFDQLQPIHGDASEDGSMSVVWSAREGGELAVYVAESLDGGLNWSTPERISPPGLHFSPDVARNADGRVAASWYGANATGQPEEVPDRTAWRLHVAERAPEGVWRIGIADETPVQVGPINSKGAGAPQRPQFDWMGIRYAPDGDLAVAYGRAIERNGAPDSQTMFVRKA